jgi:hypothetical protein
MATTTHTMVVELSYEVIVFVNEVVVELSHEVIVFVNEVVVSQGNDLFLSPCSLSSTSSKLLCGTA